jgi:hypothetical protein
MVEQTKKETKKRRKSELKFKKNPDNVAGIFYYTEIKFNLLFEISLEYSIRS